jgi:hypothetical protein
MLGKISISRTCEGALVIHPEGVNIITIVDRGETRVLSNQEPGGCFRVNAIIRSEPQ